MQMKKLIGVGLFATVAMGIAVVHAQDMFESPEPSEQHVWLHKFVGEWESESVLVVEPGQPPIKCKGHEKVRKLGEFWIVSDLEGETPMGTKMNAMLTLGYEPEGGHFVGTWVDSMMPMMWTYKGSLDEGGHILTMNTKGPDFFVPGKTADYRDIWEFKGPDHRVLTSSAKGPDGEWMTYMTANYHRKK